MSRPTKQTLSSLMTATAISVTPAMTAEHADDEPYEVHGVSHRSLCAVRRDWLGQSTIRLMSFTMSANVISRC